jgi:hypothetical protein
VSRTYEPGPTAINAGIQAARLEQAAQRFVLRVRQVPSQYHETAPAPGEWNLKQLAAHAGEICAYWAEQIRRIRGEPGGPFGRTMDDAARAQYIEDHRGDAMEALLAAIERNSTEAARLLRSFTEDEWAAVSGVHPARGLMPLDAIATAFLADHAEEHLKQLDETVAAVQR